MAISTNAANGLLDLVFRGVNYFPPLNLYLGLLDQSGAEITARANITNKMAPAASGVISNGSNIFFPAVSTQTLVYSVALYEELTGGSAVSTFTFPTPVQLEPDTAIAIPIGNINFSIEQPDDEIYYENQRIQDIDWRRVGPDHWGAHEFLRGVECQLAVVDRVETITSFGSGFAGGVLLPDGRVFCVPYDATSAKIYDPESGIISTVTGIGSGHWGGVLLQDGRVFCIPFAQTTGIVKIYNPETNAVDQITSPTRFREFIGGVLLPDGRVYCVPYGSTYADHNPWIFNPLDQTFTEVPLRDASGTVINTGERLKFWGGVLMADGRVFLVKHNAPRSVVYDPVSDVAFETPNTISSNYAGGVLLPDGRVFLAPYDSSAAAIYNPVSNVYTVLSSWGTGSYKYSGGVLLPDGRVFLPPNYSVGPARIYDPIGGGSTFTTSLGGTSTFKYFGAVLMKDGRIFCVPRDSTSAVIYGSARGYTLPDARVLSAYDNKS